MTENSPDIDQSADPIVESAPAKKASRTRRDIVALVSLAIIGLLMLGGFRELAAGKPSSKSDHPDVLPTPTVTADQSCQDFADYWSGGSGVHVGASAIAAIGNCRQAADGSWFLPIGPTDPRLQTGDVLTESQRVQTADTRSVLLAEIAQLEAKIPTSLEVSLNAIYTPVNHPITGHVRDGVTITPTRSQYTRLIQAFLISPDEKLLADYVGWRMESRTNAYSQFQSACSASSKTEYLAGPCAALEDSLSVRFPPFVWDLSNPVLIEEYLASVAQQQNSPHDTATPGASPAAP